MVRSAPDGSDKDGEVTDSCDGDSGGPLLIRRQGSWEIVGTLQVNISSTTAATTSC